MGIPLHARARVAAFALAIAAVTSTALAVDTYSIVGSVVSSGGTSADSNTCFTLAGSAGTIAGIIVDLPNDASIYSGFWIAYPPFQDSVFSARFENCGP